MRLRLVLALPVVLLATACSSTDEGRTPGVDADTDATAETSADTSVDSSSEGGDDATPDGGEGGDDATPDGGEDATSDDASTDAEDDGAADAADASTDAAPETGDAGDACHAVTFGAPAATIQHVTSLPTMTGGTIPAPAVFDAVDVQTTGSVTGTYRATWSFRGDGHIDGIEQIALNGGTPPEPVPRTLAYSAEGSTLTRTQVCDGSTTFTNQYRVRTEGPETFLEIRQDTVMFVFKKR